LHDAVSPRLVQLSHGWPRLHFSLRCLHGPHDSGILLRFRTTRNWLFVSGDAPLEDVEDGGVCCVRLFGAMASRYVACLVICAQRSSSCRGRKYESSLPAPRRFRVACNALLAIQARPGRESNSVVLEYTGPSAQQEMTHKPKSFAATMSFSARGAGSSPSAPMPRARALAGPRILQGPHNS